MGEWNGRTEPEVLMEIGGKSVAVDATIAPIVKALNEAGLRTVASCSGHGEGFGNIALAGGRELIIMPNYETARRVEWAATKAAQLANDPRKEMYGFMTDGAMAHFVAWQHEVCDCLRAVAYQPPPSQ